MGKREGEAQRKQMWLANLDTYCAKHNITRTQFVSIFTETSNNATYRSLFWSSGEPLEWMEELIATKEINDTEIRG